MRCQECQERPATVRLVRIINGQKTEQYLCAECARDKGDVSLFQPQSPFGNLLVGMMGDDWWAGFKEKPVTPLSCDQCGLTHAEFSRTGLLGCGECYRTLGHVVDPILSRVHGHSRHVGRVPRRAGRSAAAGRRLEQLRLQLDELVKQEEFEQAAVVRDQIREIEASREEGRTDGPKG